MTTIGVFASIFDEFGKILCVRQNYPPFGWTTPGGRLEDGESPEQALMREVHEETGFQVRVTRLIGLYSAPFKDDLVVSFACDIEAADTWAPNDEIAAREFFPVYALPMPMKNNTRVRIRDACMCETAVFRTFTREEH